MNWLCVATHLDSENATSSVKRNMNLNGACDIMNISVEQSSACWLWSYGGLEHDTNTKNPFSCCDGAWRVVADVAPGPVHRCGPVVFCPGRSRGQQQRQPADAHFTLGPPIRLPTKSISDQAPAHSARSAWPNKRAPTYSLRLTTTAWGGLTPRLDFLRRSPAL